MKTYFLALASLFFSLQSIYAQKGPLLGSGKIVKKEYKLTNFDKLDIADFDGEIKVEIGKPYGLKIELDDNLEPLLQVNTNNEGTLEVSLKYNKNGRLYLENTHIKIHISMPEVAVIKHRGNSNMQVKNIAGRYFRLTHQGNGDVYLYGKVDQLDIDKQGNGQVNAAELKTLDAKVNSLGNGNVTVFSQLSLRGNGAGNGAILQAGPGKIDAMSSIIGNGNVRRIK